MRYNRKEITELDPRQLKYVSFHTQFYGSQDLVINGKTYLERCSEVKPTEEEIKNACEGYEDRETFLECNKRGWAVIFKTNKNKNMYRWNMLIKVN